MNLPMVRVLAVLSCSIGLAACGGGDSDDDAIRAIIDDGADKPSTICDNATTSLLDQIGGKDACIEASKTEKGGEKADIDSVKIDGSKATAIVNGDDGKSTIEFVKEGDDWKVNASR